MGQISLGFKKIQSVNCHLLSISSTLYSSTIRSPPPPVFISFPTKSECASWCEALISVATLYYESLLKQKKVRYQCQIKNSQFLF